MIGFWFHKPEANAAAIKAFMVNRVGDFGFSLGIFAVFAMTGAVDFDTIFAQAPGLVGKTFHFLSFDVDALTLICLLLFMGAMGKSAQFLLHTWLPDAMEGPTPGLGPDPRRHHGHRRRLHGGAAIAVVRACALRRAFVDLRRRDDGDVRRNHRRSVQNDIKRIIAYSTCSQLGYMFVAMGVGAYSVGMFHLFTHAFFKALLFLGSGSVIPRDASRAGHPATWAACGAKFRSPMARC